MTDEQLEKLKNLAAEQREKRFQCENCGWFAGNGDKTDTGECRRYPPSLKQSPPPGRWVWPTVHCEAVCGEFIHRKTGKKFTKDALEAGDGESCGTGGGDSEMQTVTDLVTRLRKWFKDVNAVSAIDLMDEAADRIESDARQISVLVEECQSLKDRCVSGASVRYKLVEGSLSTHCCFRYTVVDTTKPFMIGGEQYKDICECFDEDDAELICDALNSFRRQR